MLSNYLKIAFRNLRRHPGHAGINVLGLSIGLACCVFIVLFVRDELGYDRHHSNADRIFRLVRETSALSAAPMGPAIEASIAGVESATRITGENKILVQRDDEEPFTETILFADPGYFDIFDHTFLQGSPASALANPNALVLTQSAALKYFGDESAVGKSLTIHDDEPVEFRVTGVIENVPRQSHFTFDLIASFEHIAAGSQRMENWATNWLFTYGLLSEGAEFEAVESQLPAFFERHTDESWSHFRIQPLLDVRLNSAHMTHDIGVQGNIAYVYLFGATALLILLIACTNFANLSTARSMQRAREIGVRKALGAERGQLVHQFLGESFLATFAALVVAVCLIVIGLPAFRNISGKALTLSWGDAGFLVLTFIGLILLVGLVAGMYPAFVLSRFNPVQSLRGHGDGSNSGWLRKGLVVFQFTASICLIFATMVIYRQLEYVQSASLGFDKEQVLVMDYGEALSERFEIVKSELVNHPNVIGASASDNVPGQGTSDFLFRPEGVTSEDDLMSFDTYFVDEDYTSLFGMEIVHGRTFSPNTDPTAQGFLINETAWQSIRDRLGDEWNDPVGRQLDFYLPGESGWEVYRTGQVVGVVKDFHYQSLHAEIGPLVMQVLPMVFDYLVAKVRTENLPETLAFLEEQWAVFGPERPFEYYFLDDQFDQLYRNEARLAEIFILFAGFAIFIACLGLLGLISISTAYRTKEIGIRKVLGASSIGLIGTLTSDYLKLVIFAIVIAAPLGFFALSRWLESFAYRVELSWEIFLWAGLLAVGLAWMAMIFQSLRAAMSNPVEALRYE